MYSSPPPPSQAHHTPQPIAAALTLGVDGEVGQRVAGHHALEVDHRGLVTILVALKNELRQLRAVVAKVALACTKRPKGNDQW